MRALYREKRPIGFITSINRRAIVDDRFSVRRRKDVPIRLRTEGEKDDGRRGGIAKDARYELLFRLAVSVDPSKSPGITPVRLRAALWIGGGADCERREGRGSEGHNTGTQG